MSLEWGVDFKGGAEMEVKFAERVDDVSVRKAVEAAGFNEATVQIFGPPSDNSFLIRVGRISLMSKEKAASVEQVLRAKGVPPGVLRLYGKDHMSTVEEAEGLERELGPKPKTLLVVTSPYHCRRAKLILSGILGKHELIMTPTPYERFDAIWWNHQGSAGAVVSEVAKFVFNFLGTPFRAHPAAAN